MLIYQRPRVTAGRIAFEFEGLPVTIQADPCLVYGRITGTAHVGYDGRGAWWVDQLEYSNPREPGPNVFLPVNHPLFAEVRERLDQYRAEDIGAAIERELSRGAHHRLFDEHRPHTQDRRSAPPHARRAADLGPIRTLPGRIATAALQLAGAGAELACLAALVAGALCWTLPDVPHGSHAPHRLAVVARLETTEDRP